MECRFLKAIFYFNVIVAINLLVFFSTSTARGEGDQINESNSNAASSVVNTKPLLNTEDKINTDDKIIPNDQENPDDQIKTSFIMMTPLDQHFSQINSFQEDCLKLINPPVFYFNKIETQSTQMKNFFLVRITGKLPRQKILDFSRNYIEFIDASGRVEKLVFNPQVFQIEKGSDGESFLTFIAPSSRIIKLGFVFRQKINQEYDLDIEIDRAGKINKANFYPILDLKKRLNLCPKNFIQLGFTDTLSSYNQRLASLNSDVYAAPQILQLNFNWYKVLSQSQQRIFSIESGPQEMFLPESDLFAAQNFSAIHFQAQYLWQYRQNRFNTFLKNSVLSPYFHFGFAAESESIYKFNQANDVALEQSSAIQFVGGIGFNTYIAKFWMMDFSGDIKTQGYNTGFIKSLISFEGQWSLFYQPPWSWKNSFLGINTKFIYSELSYERENGFDKSGTANSLAIRGGLFWGLSF